MHWFPILHRELRLAARRKITYRQRVMLGGMAGALALVVSLFHPFSPSAAGSSLFEFLAWSGFIFCLFEGVRETADCLSQERREGTLGLLFLTNLSGRDVVFGKFSAAMIKTTSAWLTILPILALPIWMGGVTGWEFWRVVAAMMAGLLVSLTAGLFISALSTGAFAAFIGGWLFLLGVLLWPIAVAAFQATNAGWGNLIWLSGPVGMFWQAREARFTLEPSVFWMAAAYAVLLSGLLLWAAGRAATRSWGVEAKPEANGWWQRLLRPSPGLSENWGGNSGQSNPAVWLAERTLPGRKLLWILIVAGVLTAFLAGSLGGQKAMVLLAVLQVSFGFFLKLWLAIIAPQSLHAARRSGALELLLCTPLSPIKLVEGQMDALRGYFVAPAFVVSIGMGVAGVLGEVMGGNQEALENSVLLLSLGLLWLFGFFLDLHAIGYVGLWLGLTEKRIQRAVGQTIFKVLVIPWITALVPCAGVIGILGWPVFWMWWASRQLNRRFRESVSQQYSTTLE